MPYTGAMSQLLDKFIHNPLVSHGDRCIQQFNLVQSRLGGTTFNKVGGHMMGMVQTSIISMVFLPTVLLDTNIRALHWV